MNHQKQRARLWYMTHRIVLKDHNKSKWSHTSYSVKSQTNNYYRKKEQNDQPTVLAYKLLS